MPTVVGVRFKDSGKIYHFAPQDIALAVGDWAIVETVRGPELGRVASGPSELPSDEVLGELKPVLRRATQTDLDHLAHLQQYLDDALAICAEKVMEHKLQMELVKAEYNFDGSRLTFFFTSDKRVDFRALVRDLARTFHTRIELRQIGPRDEAKLLGGIGPCGRALCCSTFLPDFARVSIKMAKDQDLPLNPTKISGVCGRLLCCLSYEHEQYLEIKAELPQRGAWVQTPEGPGEVVAVNVVRETVTVDLGNSNTIDCTAAQISAVSEQVAAEARARNAEGITPVAHMRLNEELYADADEHILAELEDRPPAPPVRLEAALASTIDRGARGATRVDQQEPRTDSSGGDLAAASRHDDRSTVSSPNGGKPRKEVPAEPVGRPEIKPHMTRERGPAAPPARLPSTSEQQAAPNELPRRHRRRRGGER